MCVRACVCVCVADPPPLSLVRKEIKKFINKGEETTYVTMEGILIIINSERERETEEAMIE